MRFGLVKKGKFTPGFLGCCNLKPHLQIPQ